MVRTRKSMSSGTTMAPTNLMAASRDWRRRSANAETKSGPAGKVSGAEVAEAADGLAEVDLGADASADDAASSPDGTAVATAGSASVAPAVREASSAATSTLLCLRRRTASLRSSI